ncbi:DUF6471 domain-containing protein [Cupriavidus basilensis]
MSHVDTPWTRLASRTARGLLARKGVSYEELANAICAMGIAESLRAAESKIQRGAYRFAFFLQVLRAVESECPPSWEECLETNESWESAATHIFLRELTTHKLDAGKLELRLAKLGVSPGPGSLDAQISSGDFPFTLVLQLALVAPVVGLDRFVDQKDIERASVPNT